MKLCKQCRKKPWPYLMALFVGLVAGFATWVIVSGTGMNPVHSLWWSATVFAVITGGLLAYMVSCMRWYCRQHRHSH